MWITDSDWKASVGAVQFKMSLVNVKPIIESSERWMRKVVGSDVWAWLIADANAGHELVSLAKQAICWYAYPMALSSLKLKVGDAGVKKGDSEVKNEVKLWEYTDTVENAKKMLNDILEDFWAELEENTPDALKESEWYARRRAMFVRSAGELTEIVPMVHGSVRLFESMTGFLRRIEELRIRPIVTAGVFDALKTKWKNKDSEIDSNETELIRLIQYVIAPLSVLEVWEYLPIQLDEAGARQLRQTAGSESEVYPINYEKDLRNTAKRRLTMDAEQAETRLVDFLNRTASDTVFGSYRLANPIDAPDVETDYENKTCVVL